MSTSIEETAAITAETERSRPRRPRRPLVCNVARTLRPRRGSRARGHPSQESAQGREESQRCQGGRGCPRRQQNRRDPRFAEASGRGDGQGVDGSHGLAAAFRPRLLVRDRREEDGSDGRFRQGRRRRAHLFGRSRRPPIPFHTRRRIRFWRRFSFHHRCPFLGARPQRRFGGATWPVWNSRCHDLLVRAYELNRHHFRRTRRYRDQFQLQSLDPAKDLYHESSLMHLGGCAVPPTSRTGQVAVPGYPDCRRAAPLRWPRSRGGSARFILLPRACCAISSNVRPSPSSVALVAQVCSVDHHIHVLRIKFDAVADRSVTPPRQRCAAAQEWIIDELAAPVVVEDRPPHQIHGLLRRMIKFFLFRAAHDEFRRRRRPDGRVLAGLAVPGRVLLPDEPAGLVLEPIERSRQDRPPLSQMICWW